MNFNCPFDETTHFHQYLFVSKFTFISLCLISITFRLNWFNATYWRVIVIENPRWKKCSNKWKKKANAITSNWVFLFFYLSNETPNQCKSRGSSGFLYKLLDTFSLVNSWKSHHRRSPLYRIVSLWPLLTGNII